MTHGLIVLNICKKFHLDSLSGCQLTERTQNSIANDQREINPKISNSIAKDQMEITPKISKAELWFMCMTHCLILLYNCMKFHLDSLSGCQLTERTQNSIANDQREINPKISKAELWFLCMTHCLIVVYNCMKFHLNSFNGCHLTERTRNSIGNDEREMTPKISKAELWLLCQTHCLIVVNNCMKFELNSFNGCHLTERTRNSIANDQREITPNISKAELWFFCLTHCLYKCMKCMKFQLNSFNSFLLT